MFPVDFGKRSYVLQQKPTPNHLEYSCTIWLGLVIYVAITQLWWLLTLSCHHLPARGLFVFAASVAGITEEHFLMVDCEQIDLPKTECHFLYKWPQK